MGRNTTLIVLPPDGNDLEAQPKLATMNQFEINKLRKSPRVKVLIAENGRYIETGYNKVSLLSLRAASPVIDRAVELSQLDNIARVVLPSSLPGTQEILQYLHGTLTSMYRIDLELGKQHEETPLWTYNQIVEVAELLGMNDVAAMSRLQIQKVLSIDVWSNASRIKVKDIRKIFEDNDGNSQLRAEICSAIARATSAGAQIDTKGIKSLMKENDDFRTRLEADRTSREGRGIA